MLLAQTGIGLGLLAMAFCDPRTDLWWLVVFAVVVAFSSATQDIALDAFRIEATDETLQGATAATYQLGYRIAVLAAGAGALYIAEFGSWPRGLHHHGSACAGRHRHHAADRRAREARGRGHRRARGQDRRVRRPHAGLPPALRETLVWIYGAIVCPFVDFFARFGWLALVLLAFIGLFRLSDIAMGVMANPFYIDMGFSLAADRQRHQDLRLRHVDPGRPAGRRAGVPHGRRAAAGAVGVPDRRSATSPSRGSPASAGPIRWCWRSPISVDNLVSGMAGSVFIAFLSGLTNTAYTATQYALFTSIMTLPGKVIGGFSGVIVDWLQARRATCRPGRLLDAMAPRPSSAASRSSSSTPRCSACRRWCWP